MVDNAYLLIFAPLTLGLVQGLLFATLLIIRATREERLSDYLLAALLVCGCLILLPILLGLLNIHVLWNEWLFLPLDPGLLIGPLVYLFILAQTNRGFRPDRSHFWHGLPFAIYAVYHLVVFAQGRDFVFHWMDSVDLPYINPVYQLATLVSMSAYLFVSIRHYDRYRRWLDSEYPNPDALRYPWITRFLWAIALIIFAICLLRIVETFFYDFDYVQTWFTSMMVAICTYYISIAGFISGRPPLLVTSDKAGHKAEAPENRLSDPEMQREMDRLVTWMESNKAYLDPDLSLGAVARALDTSRERVSAVINSGHGMNFRSFVNTYRVEAFKQAVIAGQANELTLFGLALECGFNSKATFNRVFKQIEGITPNMYANQAKEMVETSQKAETLI